jgi:hypothetical protein
MIRFIKVTECVNTLRIPLIINTNRIISIKIGDKNRDTMIQLDSKFFFVAETTEQIWGMLSNSTGVSFGENLSHEEVIQLRKLKS